MTQPATATTNSDRASGEVFFRNAPDLPRLEEPLRVAMIGSGHRAAKIYLPLLRHLTPWIRLVAVCDPLREHADRWAAAATEAGGVPVTPFYNIHELIKARPMEAAFVVVPIEAHHSLSVLLSSHKIHNHVETSWASMFCQAREMSETARKNGVVTRVAENFLRLPFDRFAQTVKRSGYLGEISRILCYNDHTGYHNNSRWIAFAGTQPQWVQAIDHSMDHPHFYSQPQRKHERETLKLRFFHFPNLGVVDMNAGHGKGLMGRHPRPGYTEWQGTRGTIVLRPTGAKWAEDLRYDLRRISDSQLGAAQEAAGNLMDGGRSDQVSAVQMRGEVGRSVRVWSDTPLGLLEHVIPFCPGRADAPNAPDIHALCPVMDHIIDFALAARGVRESEFTDEHALMSEMMEIGARESVLQEGRRIKLPLEGDVEADAITRKQLKEKYGVDPLDVEAMLSISYPRP